MSDPRPKAQNVQFPVVEPPKRTLPWLDNSAAQPVRKLFEPEPDPSQRRPTTIPPPLEEPAPQPQQARQQPPQPQPRPAAPQPQAAAPAPAPQPPPQASAQPQPPAANTGAIETLLDERVLSQLPPPPKLGSLIPGARSAPPPANDVGYEQLTQHAEAFANAATELAIARAATLSLLEGQLLDLSIEIAEALIEHEVDKNPELHTTLARAALSSLGDADRVTLRTSPLAFEKICHSLGGSEAVLRGVHVQVVADPSIPGLGCVVDGDNMRVDATVSERLRAVRRAFEEERRKSSESSE